MKTLRSLLCIGAAMVASAVSLQATPYASCITNNGSGIMSFYLNEGGGNVTITYEDGSFVTGYNGTTSGTNIAAGAHTFALGSHTSYTISVFKVGTGSPSLITNSFAFTPRGVAVNSRGASPYFGYTYGNISGGTGLWVMNSDFSKIYPAARSAGAAWVSGGLSPYRLSITPDDYLLEGDASAAHAGVYRVDPTAATSQLFLGPIGEGTVGVGNGVFGTIQSRPVVVGNPSTGPVNLYEVDGDVSAPAGYNSILVYDNITTLPYETAPSVFGPEVGVNVDSEGLGDNEYPGLQQGANGYFYASTYRNNLSNPDLQIYDNTGTNIIWTSYYNGGTADYFLTTNQGYLSSLIECAVSPDQQYVTGETIYNWLVICPLTNGIPNVANLVITTPTSFTGNGRGVCFDAADNIILSSSGLGYCQSWTLGLTTTAVTTGNASGSTSFNLSTPSVAVNVLAVTNQAYQANNSYTGLSTAVPAVFTLSLNAAQTVPVAISFTLGGTATNGVNYTANYSSVVTFPVGVTNENVIITPTASPASGPSLTVTLTLKGSASYSAIAPSSATASIANSGAQSITVGTITDPTFYRGTPGDYAGFQVVRYGDTNVSFTVPASSFNYSGTAVYGTDYVSQIPALSFPAGTYSVLAEAGSPVSTAFPYTYVGNKTIVVSLSGGSSPEGISFTVSGSTTGTLTLLDNAYPPETVLFSDSLTNSGDTNWTLAFGSVANGTAPHPIVTLITNYQSIVGGGSDAAHDFDVEFGYTLANDPAVGALPPNGSPTALKVTVNKVGGVTYTETNITSTATNITTVTGATGGVSLYPAPTGTALVFSNNFALRFSVFLYEDTGGSATEFGNWGINHLGTNANWWAGSYSGGAGNTNIDGVWYSLGNDQGGASFGDVLEFTSTNFPNSGWVNLGTHPYSYYAGDFKNPPYNSSGANSLAVGYGSVGYLWNDVEIKQFNNIISMTINKSLIYSYTNTTGLWKSGDVMLGYEDPFDSIGTLGEAYYSNMRVVTLGGPTITAVAEVGTNIYINFTSPDGDAVASSFSVMYTTNLLLPFTNTATATFTQTNGTFTAVTAGSTATNATKFYVIKQSNAAL